MDKFFVTDVDKFLVTSNKEFVRQTRFVLMKVLRKTKMFVHLSYVEKAITNEKIIFLKIIFISDENDVVSNYFMRKEKRNGLLSVFNGIRESVLPTRTKKAY